MKWILLEIRKLWLKETILFDFNNNLLLEFNFQNDARHPDEMFNL